MLGSVAPVSKSLRACRALSHYAGQRDLLGQTFCVDSVLIHFAQSQNQLEIDAYRRRVAAFPPANWSGKFPDASTPCRVSSTSFFSSSIFGCSPDATWLDGVPPSLISESPTISAVNCAAAFGDDQVEAAGSIFAGGLDCGVAIGGQAVRCTPAGTDGVTDRFDGLAFQDSQLPCPPPRLRRDPSLH